MTGVEAVVASNFNVIDSVLYRLWLLGLGVDQAVHHCLKVLKENPISNRPSDFCIKSFIHGQYRNFVMLEPYLHHPKSVVLQLTINNELKQFITNLYYQMDEKVVREFIAKKLNFRVRKDLEQVSAKTKVPILGCRRMFDNLKRVVKRVEDAHGDIERLISTEFCIKSELASQYATVAFLNQYRFETTKKKVATIPLSAISSAAHLIIAFCTEKSSDAIKELNLQIAQDARDLKTLIFNHKETNDQYKQLLLNDIVSKHPAVDRATVPLALNKAFKNMLTIVSQLPNSKEQRELFNQLIDKCIDVFISLPWTREEMRLFFDGLVLAFNDLNINPQIKKRIFISLENIIKCFGGICLCFIEFMS